MNSSWCLQTRLQAMSQTRWKLGLDGSKFLRKIRRDTLRWLIYQHDTLPQALTAKRVISFGLLRRGQNRILRNEEQPIFTASYPGLLPEKDTPAVPLSIKLT